MMLPTESLVILSASTLIGLTMAAGFGAWAWSGWLKLRHHQIDRAGNDHALPLVGERIDIADLKERIRKLEAIAAGVEL
jgi:hypothetical protein